MAPSIWEFWMEPELLKVQEIFSTMSTKISSRTLPSVREVSRMDLMTPVGPLPTPENSEPLPPLCSTHRLSHIKGHVNLRGPLVTNTPLQPLQAASCQSRAAIPEAFFLGRKGRAAQSCLL